MSLFRSLSSAAHPWAGANEKDVFVAMAAIETMILNVTAQPVWPTEIVAGGPFNWRREFLRVMRGYRLVDDKVADDLYELWLSIHRQRFGDATPAEVLDAWAPPPVLTQAEIDAGWELESDSTVEARKFFYGDRWDAPHRVMEELNDPKAHDPITVVTH